MKKDPLTQTSINSFFSTNSNKREPDDKMNFNENHSENAQRAKRRKVSDSNDYLNVNVKTEPIDEPMDEPMSKPANTFNGEQVPIKTEPGAYNSDYEHTDEESDNEEANEAFHGAPATSAKRERNGENRMDTDRNSPHSMTKIKQEQNSDNDTDTPSDDDDNEPVSSPIRKHTNQPFRVKTEPGLEQLPTVTHDTPAAMNYNDEQMQVDNDFKEEPQDDPIESDQETDDEQSSFDQSKNQQQQPNVSPYHDENIEWYQNQQPSTSSKPTMHFNQFNSGQAHSSSSSSGSSNQFKPINLNLVGSKSSQPVNMADGKPLLRFNHFEPANEIPSHDVVNDEDDEKDDDFDGLDDEIENYVKIIEQQNIAYEQTHLEQLKKISKHDKLGNKELIALQRKADEIKKRKQAMQSQKVKELQRQTEEQKEQEKDKFIQILFGPFYDFNRFDRLCRIDTADGMPSTSRASGSTSTNTTDKKDKKPITWRELMDRPKIEADHKKSEKAYHASVVLDKHIKLKLKENKLDEVPEKAIKHVLRNKVFIKNEVDRVLKPYLRDGKINKKEFESICKHGTHDCFESKIYGKRLLYFSSSFFSSN